MKKLDELERHFKNSDIPKNQIRIDKCTVVLKPQQFIEAHIATLRGKSGNKTFMPYYERLVKFKNIIDVRR